MSIVLLEHPRLNNSGRCEEVVNAPLSACLFTGYIASVLRENKLTAEVANAHLYDWSIEETITHIIANKQLQLMCVHTVYLWERTKDIFDMLSTLKTANEALHINLYGYFPTFAYKNILTDYPFVDSVTVGEPEFTTLDLARGIVSENRTSTEIPGSNTLLKKNRNPLSCPPLANPGNEVRRSVFPDRMNIPGLAFRDKDGKIVFTPRPPIHNLDRLPYPCRQDVTLCQKKGIVTYIQGSRGCYGHCAFCYLNPFYGQTSLWRGRSANNIFDEIFKLHTKYSIENFYFSDANFFGPGKYGSERASALADLILANSLNIRFGFECRVNDIEEKTIEKLVLAGLANVFLGLESGDDNSLKRFKKHTTSEENKKAIRLLRNYGIEPTFGFIMFEPHSTMQSIHNNFEFLKETGIMTSPAVTAHLLHHRQTVFQGTPAYPSIMQPQTKLDDSSSSYEIFYKIKDSQAAAFSIIIKNICKDILALLPQTFVECNDMVSDTRFDSPLLKKLNEALITAFENILHKFESASIVPNCEHFHSTHNEIINNVQSLLLHANALHEPKRI